jgi:PilZ domain-containing protein
METRRRSERVTLLYPIAARAGGESAHLLDASIEGVRLSHAAPLVEGNRYSISLDWSGTPIEFTAALRWSKPQGSKYQSGFAIEKIDPASSAALYTFMNAHADETPRYDHHELIYGVWKKTTSTDSRQPESGFTVISTESEHAVSSMRAAYSGGDPKMRERIRKLAELSIRYPERH